jgi:hypothetical protein
MTSQVLAIEPNCDRTLIPNLNGHISTKYPTGDRKPIASERILEALKEGFCDYWRSGICKAGAAALACIGIEGELRDDQHSSANIEKGAVHLALIVAKDTQIDNFISQGLALNLVIVLPYSKEYQKSLTYVANDLFVNRNTGTAYPLY